MIEEFHYCKWDQCSHSPFLTELDLYQHLSTFHIREGKQKCLYRKYSDRPCCSSVVKHKGQFLDHIISHFTPQLRPLPCLSNSCENSFRNRQERVKHIRSLHPELDSKPLGEKNTSKKSTAHSKTVHKEKEEKVKFNVTNSMENKNQKKKSMPSSTTEVSILEETNTSSLINQSEAVSWLLNENDTPPLSEGSSISSHSDISTLLNEPKSKNLLNNENNQSTLNEINTSLVLGMPFDYEMLPLRLFTTPTTTYNVGFYWKVFLRSLSFLYYSAGLEMEPSDLQLIRVFREGSGLVPITAQESMYSNILERIKFLDLDFVTILAKRQLLLCRDMLQRDGLLIMTLNILNALKKNLKLEVLTAFPITNFNTQLPNFQISYNTPVTPQPYIYTNTLRRILSRVALFVKENYRRSMNNDTDVEMFEISYKSPNWCNPGDCSKSQLGLWFKFPCLKDQRILFLRKQEIYAFVESYKERLSSIMQSFLGDFSEAVILKDLCCKGAICDLGKQNSSINLNLFLIDNGNKSEIKLVFKIGFDSEWVKGTYITDMDDLFLSII
ncbi:hypothetical protein HK099_003481 [Clydaea vesicula]|uniref:C2H2-type domain-containing protein n=1 Tax=Clydaea vesicula TaxID=447962 RepID=A0AAD5U3I2_9FUNG|nr:hypothetical protein HK099_003481 [Clydaea vesicula]